MSDARYEVALVTRGAGAYTYTYAGPAGLATGCLCAVLFRERLEVGVVAEAGAQPPPTVRLQPLVPLAAPGLDGWGGLLLLLAEAMVAGPDEVAGHLLFAQASTALRLSLRLDRPDDLAPGARDRLAPLAGPLTPAKRGALPAAVAWEELAQAAAAGAVVLELGLAGLPGQTRESTALRRWYTPDPATLRLIGIGQVAALPGGYLAGLREAADYTAWPATNPPDAPPVQPPPTPPVLEWTDHAWPDDWEALKRWPLTGALALRRTLATWGALRGPGGLPAELALSLAQGERVLVIAPQVWMLDRLWPLLAPWAEWVLRHHSEGGPSAAAYLLRRLAEPGVAVLGGPGAWKLAAYASFDRVLLLDPSHPQYEPEREPQLDSRVALLLALAQRARATRQTAGPCVELVELGLSALDGLSQLRHLALLDPFQAVEGEPQPGATVDLDPVPLTLRQPTRRRLVYFNRLGRSRGLKCMECDALVGCPQCGAHGVYYSGLERSYICPKCGWRHHDLRCAVCGLGTIAAQLPGLEAVTRRPGDLIVAGILPERLSHPELRAVIGTAGLLEPLADFWPEEIVYVHAEARLAFLDDWPRAVDLAARLTALYANPDLEYTYLISARLREQLGPALTAAQIQGKWREELQLRRLAGLPPYGCVYHLKLRAQQRKALALAREGLGQALTGHPGTLLLRLGRVYQAEHRYQTAGYLVNPRLGLRELLDLRWAAHRAKAGLSIRPLRGPWV